MIEGTIRVISADPTLKYPFFNSHYSVYVSVARNSQVTFIEKTHLKITKFKEKCIFDTMNNEIILDNSRHSADYLYLLMELVKNDFTIFCVFQLCNKHVGSSLVWIVRVSSLGRTISAIL